MSSYQKVHEILTDFNIHYLYGIPGEGILDLLNDLADGSHHFVSARQMWAAGYMAMGDAWISGRPALCAAGDAYGVELIRPLREARRHRLPVVILACGDWIPLLDPVIKQRFDTAEGGDWTALLDSALQAAAREPAAPVLLALPGSETAPAFRPSEDPAFRDGRRPAAERREEWKGMKDQLTQGPDFPPTPIPIFETLQQILTPDDLILCDGGLVGLWAERFLEPLSAGRLFVPPPGATPGAASPLALGARLAHPEGRVIVITDDASYNTSVLEIETMRRMGASIVTLVFRSSHWEWARVRQEQLYNRTAFVEYRCPNLIRLTQVAGGKSVRLERGDSLKSHLKYAFTLKGPVTIDCPVDMRGAAAFIKDGGGPVSGS
ncbi:MAG: hypothetical protein KJ970_00605 [Candidatus Eisenbacteria bacterium]|uniref:Thiamine pyrophosphate-binding protein n=1 Tax=Eiseniibacteriota bacterium TaxID=2212470 RepID=A0A948RR83_UNCEI|nr:hypothetical protein [Candidatus Eisenbacteria bacterium]MBU1950060.1 hypothetical protein [Candidatus Eisenbacteria bacterium]MBU2689400.1 hypothetical protein [Candidatus Eisenbacteria bacterium]